MNADAPSRIRVLHSFPGPRPTTNPYLTQLLRSLPPEVTSRGFSWSSALWWRYDVLHLHWPENLLRGTGRWKKAARHLLFVALLIRLRVRHTAVVRTLHNEAPHEGGSRVERALLRAVDRRTTLWLRLNETTIPPLDGPVRTIVHGHYSDWYAALPRSTAQTGRLLSIGLIRPYKGVDTLVDAFSRLTGDDVALRIVGRPTTERIRADVEAATRADPRVSALLSYVDDETVARETSAAELVVLPYRALHNSGVLLLALSLGTPVLAPANDISTALANEVGPGWVLTYEGTLTAADLRAGLAASRLPGRTATPDLSAREWAPIGTAHAEAYRAAIRAARR